jgi:hypothetical protein
MFASSSLTSLSSDVSSEHENEPVAASSTVANVIGYSGPFASQPDLEAVKYLKDSSISSVFPAFYSHFLRVG